MVHCKSGFIYMKKTLLVIISNGTFIIIYLISPICIVIYISFLDSGSDLVIATGWDPGSPAAQITL